MENDVMEELRLDRWLVQTSGLTRKEAKAAAKAGRVQVDGSIVKNSDTKIKEEAIVLLDGKQQVRFGKLYLMLNKPAGIVSATQDNHDKTVIELLGEQEGMQELALRGGLFPVGRLDKDTEGLLVLTNDGELSHRLLSPRHHVDKVYYAILNHEVPDDAVRRFAEGIEVGTEYKALPAKLTIISSENGKAEVSITLQEGKFHQVKRMCHEIGCEVVYLKRVAMGKIQLDEALQKGQARFLTEQEIDLLQGDNREDAEFNAD